MLIVNQFKISQCAPSLRGVLKRYLMLFTCILPICKHRHGDKEPHNAQDASCGWIHFWGFRPCVLSSRAKTRKRRRQSTCQASQSGWKSLSLCPQSSPHTPQSCCRTLRILKVLTLSNQLQDTDVRGLFDSICKVRAVKTYSEHIFDALTFFHRTVSGSARHGRISSRARACAGEHMCLCVHMQWLTPPSQCQIKVWKMVGRRKKGGGGGVGGSPSLVVASVIWSIPCNYRDLCCSAFQSEFVSQPPVEIWSVF